MSIDQLTYKLKPITEAEALRYDIYSITLPRSPENILNYKFKFNISPPHNLC